MQVDYTSDAFETSMQLTNFIENTNTKGAGVRWLNKYETFLEKKFSNAHKIRLCNNLAFYKLNLRCIYFNDWVIAFSVIFDSILIEAILHKSKIID